MNPVLQAWRHLGSLAFLCFVACTLSGLYLYAVFDTSVAGAYESGRALDRDPLGSLVRGVHRYSADAFATFTALHLLREALRRHFRFHRAWSWLSGVALVPFAWTAGITGFWLAWDERAFFSVMDVAEWFAAWPFGLALFARNFVSGAAMNDRFFSLVVFVHLGVPLLALAATWAHVQRLSQVRAWPPAALTVPALAALALLAALHPARSLAPAEALLAPTSLAVDWFYFFPHAIASALGPAGLWGVVVAGAILLAALPWMPGRPRPAAARVDLARCNGCGRCEADCPFNAVEIVARSDGRAHRFEARVDAGMCAGCGICAGACPSSTPFRRRAQLTSGIELPQPTLALLRDALDRRLEAQPGGEVVFACGADVPCVAMVPPAFVDYALRRGASRVVMAACARGDCEHRLGERWVRERFAGLRPPALHATVPRDRVRLSFRGETDD